MIVVTKIKTANINRRDVYEFCHENKTDNLCAYDSISDEITPLTREMIYGRDFINADGERVCIGWSKQVQDLLGLPFEVFENQSAILNKYMKKEFDLTTLVRKKDSEIIYLRNQITRYDNMSLWKRLIFFLRCKL